MEISWFGHSCFQLNGKHVTLVTDPFIPQQEPNPLSKVKASIVTISHTHADHSYAEGISGSPFIVRGPGEYEVKDVLITGVAAYHDNKKGQDLGRNTIYVIHLDDIAICHLGDLGQPLQESQLEQVADADVLFVPIGGGHTLNPTQAAEVISQIEPRIVIPMHYPPISPGEAPDATHPLTKFNQEMGVEVATPQIKVNVTRTTLPASMQVILLSIR